MRNYHWHECVRLGRVVSAFDGFPICVKSGDQCASSSAVVLFFPEGHVAQVQHSMVLGAYT